MKKVFKKVKFLFFALPLLVFVLVFIFYLKQIETQEQELETGRENCIEGFFLVPVRYSLKGDFEFEYRFEKENILFANELCIKSTGLLAENEQYQLVIAFLGEYGLKIFEKPISFFTEDYPKIAKYPEKKEFLVNEKIFFELDKKNKSFDYYITINEKEAKCEEKEQGFECNLETLELKQGEEYELSVFSQYGSEKVSYFEPFVIKTPSPVIVEKSSINDGANVYEEVSLLEIVFNKDVDENIEIFFENEKGEEIGHEISLEGSKLIIRPLKAISFGTNCNLVIKDINGVDGSFFEGDYVLRFNVIKRPVQNWWAYPTDMVQTPKSGDDLLVVVSKKYFLPKTYAPSDLVPVSKAGIPTNGDMYARSIIIDDLRELGKAAKADGINISIRSAYRSYNTQVSTYQYWINYNNGNQNLADQVSARPGHSEHQLGTTIDFATNETAKFNESAAAIWLENNAHNFGFVISYPKGAHEITGYSYEGWHYRYIGRENAKKQNASGLVLVQWLERN